MMEVNQKAKNYILGEQYLLIYEYGLHEGARWEGYLSICEYGLNEGVRWDGV